MSIRLICRTKTLYNVPHGGNNQDAALYISKLLIRTNRVEWMKGICLIWSRGRLISPSLPVGDDWYLNLTSQKRPPGRNLGEHRLVRRSGTASEVLFYWYYVCACAVFLELKFFPIFLIKKIRKSR